ncbi:MAG: NAD(P)-binding protein [Acidobacteriota bacterium]|jgi:flavin-dependent dehydrogenase
MTRTVHIAGGGVSGLATALLLARRGVAVEVHERKATSGGRFAGGWQVLENGSCRQDALEEIAELGIEPSFDTVPARHATFLDGAGRVFEVASSAPFAYFVRRGGGAGSLDDALGRQARAAGAVFAPPGEAPERVDVVATGPRQADGVAKEVVFSSDLQDTVAVLFDPLLTPSGYAYLFCLGGHATFGVAQVRGIAGLARARDAAWARFREVFGAFRVERLHDGGQFMNFCIPAHLSGRDGRWYVGEAAGVQDYLFGLGNRLALRSAGLVADGLLGHWDQRAFVERLRQPMIASVALRFAYERAGRRSFAALCRRAARGDFRELLVQLQAPRSALRGLSRLIMAIWRERGGCRHAPVCSWCRRRPR